MSNLKGKKIILGVSGGIAAFKACEILRRLQEKGSEIHVVLTQAAQKFVTPLTFQSLSQNPVHTDLFNLTEESEMSHIKLADEADLLLIAPATADLIGRLAHGLADDLLTTVALVTKAPLLLAPSMNVNMWEKAVVQENIQTLKKRGVRFLDPESGYLACGWEGKGRLPGVDVITEEVEQILKVSALQPQKKKLAGKNILITAGPTREFLDPVRYLSNPSSGKMGFALAQSASDWGAQVTLITGPVQLPSPPGVHRIDINSAEEMLAACQSSFDEADVLIATAAVGDYRVDPIPNKKIKKSEGSLKLTLVPNPDILTQLSLRKKNGQLVIGFAAESERLIEHATEKLKKKKLDMIVANDISDPDIGFNSDQNKVVLIFSSGETKSLPVLPKTEVAEKILNEILELLNAVGDQRKVTGLV
jgi:phosphopantothenoylcysteine decarboxylase/phosphopantothenate--cysteine ligase